MNPLDFVILAVIAAAIVGALVAVKKHKCGTCHGDCGNCGKRSRKEENRDRHGTNNHVCFFVHDLRNLFKMDKFAKTRKKLLTTLVSNGKLFAEC